MDGCRLRIRLDCKRVLPVTLISTRLLCSIAMTEYELADGRILRVEDDDAVSIEYSDPRDVHGHELEWFDDGKITVQKSRISIVAGEDSILYIPRDGWELDSYIVYTRIPGGLADELEELGFHHDSSGDRLNR